MSDDDGDREKKTKTKEEKLEKSKRILEEAELKKKELTIIFQCHYLNLIYKNLLLIFF